MTHRPQDTLYSHSVCAAALPRDGAAPEWITIFPKTGRIATRDNRAFSVDGDALLGAFAADAIDVPVDVMHQTDTALATGGRADAVGWIVELRLREGALEGRVDWNEEGRALLAARKYRFTSPSFFHDSANRATRLKAVALVTAPALGNQPALASLQPAQSETSMKLIAATLGLSEDANETSCLAALKARLDAAVPKVVHDETLANLTAAAAELGAIKAAGRKARIDALIDGALKARKITPAERAHYEALCATDEGLASVEKLIAAKPALLAGSALDERRAPEADARMDAALLAAQANKLVADGRASDIAEAMTLITERQTA